MYAGGMGLVAACDMGGVDTAGFCLSEVKLGLIPATISPYVIRAMGARAHRYFLTAERLAPPRRCASALCTSGGSAEQLDAKVDELLKGPHQRQPQRRARVQEAGDRRGRARDQRQG